MSNAEQEPVAYINIEERKLEWAYKYMSWDTPTVINLPKIPLYTTPPQRNPLTDEQIAEMWLEILGSTPPSGIHEDGLQPWRFARAIEAAHGIKE